MRGAGCTYNDIVDRDFDAQVARTRARPIPSGAVSVKQAWAFLAAQCLVGLLILLALNPLAMVVGAASLLLVAAYPFMKRVTWWPQAWLGLTFNWGVLLGCAAAADTLPRSAFVLYAACLFWTLGYDTIYALQDMEDDALIGVKSTARLFGHRAPVWVFLFYAMALALFAMAGIAVGLGLAFMLLLVFVGLHFLWQVRQIDVDRPAVCLRLFRANRDAGALMALAADRGNMARTENQDQPKETRHVASPHRPRRPDPLCHLGDVAGALRGAVRVHQVRARRRQARRVSPPACRTARSPIGGSTGPI